jgi:hypothetical protein
VTGGSAVPDVGTGHNLRRVLHTPAGWLSGIAVHSLFRKYQIEYRVGHRLLCLEVFRFIFLTSSRQMSA